jgi:hypothetical protein
MPYLTCGAIKMNLLTGTKIALSGICVAVFPASTNPDRRYIQLADPYGSAGLTIWNDNVRLFGPDTVGKLVTCKKLAVTQHNGKRVLTMTRESTLSVDDDGDHAVVDWWKNLLKQRAMTALEAHSAPENAIISISGVVGHVNEETKIVSGKTRILTTIHLVDATGKFDVRTWNHTNAQFSAFVDRPVTIQRVRVTAFAGDKLAEYLDGHGSIIETSFPGSDALSSWWTSSVD